MSPKKDTQKVRQEHHRDQEAQEIHGRRTSRDEGAQPRAEGVCAPKRRLRTADFSVYADGAWHFYRDDGTYLKGVWIGAVAGDIPAAGDFNHTGGEDPSIFRNGVWLFFDDFFGTANYHLYYPFGEEATPFNQDTIRAKFTGHERDLGNPGGPGDDLDYMHARHCSPVTGRFLSPDPKSRLTVLLDPQRWNRYSYVSNSPLALIDLNGREQVTFTITTAIQASMVSAPILGLPPIRHYAGGLKTFQRFTVETDPRKSAKPILPGAQKGIGETRRVDANGKPTGERATASSNGLVLFSGRDSQGNAQVLASGIATNPLHQGAPPITYSLMIAPNQAGTSFSLTGSFGGYPNANGHSDE